MYNKKSVYIVLIYIAFTMLIVFQSFNVQRKNAKKSDQINVIKDQETVFNNLNYYSVEDSKPVLNINAELLKIVNNQNLFFTAPVGYLVDEETQKINYKADKGTYKSDKRELELVGSVSLTSKKGNHKSDLLFFNATQRYLEARGQVQSNMKDLKTSDEIIIESNYMSSWMNKGRSLFLGRVKGRVKRKRIYEESFNFKSEKLELNQLESLVKLSKSVELDRNNYHLEAEKAEIFLENFNKKLKYYVLYDDIKLVEKLELRDGTSSTRRAYSEKLEGYMSEAKVVLSGAPRVESGRDRIKGYQITLRENVELVEVDDSQSSFELKRK